MKRTWILTLSALLVAAAPILADKTTMTLLNARTTNGPSSAIHASASSAETGAENWFFQVHKVGFLLVRLEISLDGGAHWVPVHLFLGEDSLFTQRACGGCRMRVNVESSLLPDKTGAISVWVTQSGALVPVVTPALVPTVTP